MKLTTFGATNTKKNWFYTLFSKLPIVTLPTAIKDYLYKIRSHILSLLDHILVVE